jgi:Uma2 family endonuclease
MESVGDTASSRISRHPTRLGLAEFLTLPEDGKRYEILDGDLFVSPSPNTKHQKIVLRLSSLLYTALELNGLGSVLTAPYDVVLADHDIVEPDLLFVRKRRIRIIGEQRIKGAP